MKRVGRPMRNMLYLALAAMLCGGASAQRGWTWQEGLHLESYALRGPQDTSAKLYLGVESEGSQAPTPSQFEHVWVQVRTPDGRPVETNTYADVPLSSGLAVIDLGDIPLLDVVSVHALAPVGYTGRSANLEGRTAVTEFAVNPTNVVVPDFEGFGAQMNGYLYAAQNDPTKGTGNVPPQDVQDLEAKVISLHPGLVRIFLSPADYLPGNQNLLDSVYSTAELAQRAGADVNITWWYIDQAPASQPAEQQQLMQQDMQEFASTLQDLIQNHGVTAIRQITIQNEVDSTKITPQLYEQYYRLLDQYLREDDLRDHIQFIGGDLVINNQKVWLDYMAQNMGDVLDGWSVHIYWSYWDAAYMISRLDGILAIYNSLPPQERKPLSITEYGVRGVKAVNGQTIMVPDPYRDGKLVAFDPGMYLDSSGNQIPMSETNVAGFQQAWFNMVSLNDGFVGLSKWDMYQAQYDFGYQDYSLIGYLFNPEPGQDRWSLRPSYFMQWLMANTTGQHWKVLGYSGTSGAKLITPFAGPWGARTLFAMSTDGSAATVTVGNLRPGQQFHVFVWNGDGSGQVSDGGWINAGSTGVVSIQTPAGGFVALTTVPLSQPDAHGAQHR
jgi:hypothetical protein